jgi:ribose transport system ATP-binding protein
MKGICKSFGPTRALQDVELEVYPGQVLALIGENGAGKSTLMKVLSGAHGPDSGTMRLAGKPYAPSGPHDARTAGVGMIYQELNLADDLSVEDNIMLGREQCRFGMGRFGMGRFGIIDRASQRQRVRAVLDQLGHPDLRPETPVRELSVALQQLVEIARAMIVKARVLVFDEPTSSLTRKDVIQLFQVIRNLRDSGIGIVYISHFLEEVREVCDHYSILRDGKSVGHGKLADVREDEIVAMMVGRTVDELFPTVAHEPGEVILTLDRVSGAKIPNQVSLEVRRGEIVGISGLVGAGRTELLRCLAALDPVRSGKVRVGQMEPAPTPRARIQAGLGFVSEDRKGEGLAQSRSIADNMTYSRLDPYSRFGMLNLPKRRQAVQRWIGRLQVKARSQDQEIEALSGGNQQKVALARVMHQDADILLLDEPTRGIDVGTKSEIYRLMGELAADGKAILFVSSYLTELMEVCDRIAVMARGQIRAVRPVKDWTEEGVMRIAIATENG